MQLSKTVVATALVALLGAASACGSNDSSSSASDGGDSTPTATAASFCSTLSSFGADTSPADAADKLAQVGTPSDASAAERDGFQVLVDHIKKLPDNAKADDFSKMEKSLTTTEQKDIQAFFVYVQKECASQTPAPSESPSESPSS